jgi:hypothetical protein
LTNHFIINPKFMGNDAMEITRFKMKKFRPLVLLLAGLMGLVSISSAYAQDCRLDPNVNNSANPFLNTGMGGHLNKHIFTMPAPNIPGNSALNATMFNTVPNWNSLWRGYRSAVIVAPQCPPAAGPATVPSNAGPGALPANAQVDGYDCTAVDAGNNTQCTTIANQFVPGNYRFVFRRTVNGWVVLTAYPQ